MSMTSSEVFRYWLKQKYEDMYRSKETGELTDVRFEMSFHSAERTEIQYTAIVPSLGKRVRIKQSVTLMEEPDERSNRKTEGEDEGLRDDAARVDG